MTAREQALFELYASRMTFAEAFMQTERDTSASAEVRERAAKTMQYSRELTEKYEAKWPNDRP